MMPQLHLRWHCNWLLLQERALAGFTGFIAISTYSMNLFQVHSTIFWCVETLVTAQTLDLPVHFQVGVWSSCISSLCVPFSGEPLRKVTELHDLRISLLWLFLMCIFSPFSVPKIFSHWSQAKDFFRREVSSSNVSFNGSLRLFLRNSSFLLRFLLREEGLFLFFSFSWLGWFSLAQRIFAKQVGQPPQGHNYLPLTRVQESL